ncbi:fam-c protein [Plasmodium vinckei lentum]|uniref:Fam-c protein n=1 Tax=Plasmodium vinckei lentum TaxID=138297 RepID=A0A6V7RZG7_PLAVN|nr:fam-c protein [Plasmodium vinckei lentum]
MNKRIFSLVCIVLYILVAVSIHCSEQKASGLRSRIIRAIKQIKKSNKKNGIKSKHKPQLNDNNNNYYHKYDVDDMDREYCYGDKDDYEPVYDSQQDGIDIMADNDRDCGCFGCFGYKKR